MAEIIRGSVSFGAVVALLRWCIVQEIGEALASRACTFTLPPGSD